MKASRMFAHVSKKRGAISSFVSMTMCLGIATLWLSGCSNEHNNLIGTWELIRPDRALPTSLWVQRLVVRSDSLDEFPENSKESTTVPIKLINDHVAIMSGLFGASIKLEVLPTGSLHLSDPDSLFKKNS